jgi:hypothetical protein
MTVLETDSKYPHKFGAYWHTKDGFRPSLNAKARPDEGSVRKALIQQLIKARREEIRMLEQELANHKNTHPKKGAAE